MFEEARRAEPVVDSFWLEEIFFPDASLRNDGSSVHGVEEVKATHATVEGVGDGALGEVADGTGGWVMVVVGGCDERLYDEILTVHAEGGSFLVRRG